MSGALWVVATPIGNLEDLTPRAADALRLAAVVLCEDTRHSATLLGRVGSSARALSLHANNETARIPSVLATLQQGQNVALVSDAGTPCLSDPGARLVAAVHDAGFAVRTLPGPFAAAAAIAGSGLVPQPFGFWGFLPKKGAARQQALRQRLTLGPDGEPMTHAFYVPGRDLAEVLADVAAVQDDLKVVVARELTKLHETWHRGVAGTLAAQFPADALRGEAVLLVQVDAPLQGAVALDLDAALLEVAAAKDRKEALRALAKRTGQSRRTLYARLTALVGEGATPASESEPEPS